MLVATGCPAIYRNIYWIVNSANSNKLYIIWYVVIKKWNRIYVSQNICDCWRFISLKCWSITACIVQYNDVIMSSMASQITSLTIVYSTVYSRADQRKHQSSASLAFVRGIHRWPVNSPHKWPVTRKMFPFDDVIMDRGVPYGVRHYQKILERCHCFRLRLGVHLAPRHFINQCWTNFG